MYAAISQFSARTMETICPPLHETLDHPTVMSAIERQRVARISKLAVFIFSTAYTLATATLAEAGVVTAAVALPALLVSLVFWGLFFRLNNLDDAYVEKIDDTVRQDLAKRHLERLLFEVPLTEAEDLKQLYSGFAHVNALLGTDIFTADAFKQFTSINFGSHTPKSLFEAAHEQAVPLSLDLQTEKFEPGRFGWPSRRRIAAIKWNGQKDSAIAVSLQTIAEATQAANEQGTAKNESLEEPQAHL